MLDMDLPTTSWQSPTFPWRGITDDIRQKIEREEKEKEEAKKKKKKPRKSEKKEAGRVRRIRLYPTVKQRQTLKEWFGTTRWTYNRCLSFVKEQTLPKKKRKTIFRAIALNSELFKTKNQWVLQTPYDVRDEGMNDLLKAFDSNFSVRNC